MKKSYYYADGQILSQRVHTDSQDPTIFTPYFYVHDRLGSVRLVIDSASVVRNSYTYKPYGQFYDGECDDEWPLAVDNPWKFTGQYYDEEIAQYYLRARQYDPAMMRFTSRDPIRGNRENPLTLHRYLYCLNDPASNIDPTGENAMANALVAPIAAGYTYHAIAITVAAYGVATMNWDFLDLGIAIDQNLGRLMSLASAGIMGPQAIKTVMYRTYPGGTRDYPWKDKNNMERFLSETEKAFNDPDPPKGPWWKKVLYYCGKVADMFYDPQKPGGF